MNREFKRGFKSAFSLIFNDMTRERIPQVSTEVRIRKSWENIGNDLRKSMDKIDTELAHVKQTTKN